MPIPALALALAPSLLNGAFQTINNAANKSNTIAAANLEQQFAIDNWNRNNAYNSPAAQMTRYKEAGLNPNLIYGQMSNSPAIKSPDVQVPQRNAPQIENPSHSLLAYQQLKQSQAQTSLITQQALAAQEDARLKQAQVANINADTALKTSNTGLTDFNLYSSRQRLAPSLEGMQIQNSLNRQQIAKTSAETGNLLQAHDIQKLMVSPNLSKTLAEIANLKQHTLNQPYQRALWLALANDAGVKAALGNIERENNSYNLQRKLNTGAEAHDSYPFRLAQKSADVIAQWFKKNTGKGKPFFNKQNF
jgi:hypothetical protein